MTPTPTPEGGLSAENAALFEQYVVSASLRFATGSLLSELNALLNAARAEGREAGFADIRASWRGDETCRRLDDVRANIAGLRPGDAEALAMFQERFALMSRTSGPALVGEPVDMVLFCPACGKQHIDEPEPSLGRRFQDPGRNDEWTNPPHRSHLCGDCGHIWRPADIATNGVLAIKTKGKADSLGQPVVALMAGDALESALVEAVRSELEDAGTDAPYGVIAERVAAHVVDALAISAPRTPGAISVFLAEREDGGLRVWSDDEPGLVLSGADPKRVGADIWAVIQALRAGRESDGLGAADPHFGGDAA